MICNKCFIHSPAEKRPELCNQALAVSDDQAVVFRCGIIDKTEMYEADSRTHWHDILYGYSNHVTCVRQFVGLAF